MDTLGDGNRICEYGPNAVSEPARSDWITDELIRQTIRVWEKRSSTPLSNDDAVQLIFTMGQLLDATGLTRVEEVDEEIYGMGKSE